MYQMLHAEGHIYVIMKTWLFGHIIYTWK